MKSPFIPPTAFDSELEQRDMVISGQDLEEVILSRAIVVAQTGKKRNMTRNVPLTRPPNVVDLPGDTVNMDIGLFGSPNPFENRETARFGIDQFQTDRIFPGPTYQYNVVGNDGNQPYIFEGIDITPLEQDAVPEIEYVGFPMQPRLPSTFNFVAPQNQFSAFQPASRIPGNPVSPPNPQDYILPSSQKVQVPSRLY
jgi:hypothetical protein